MNADPSNIARTIALVTLVVGGVGLVCFAAYKVWKQRMSDPNQQQPVMPLPQTSAVTQDFSAKYAAMTQARADLTAAEESVLVAIATLDAANSKCADAKTTFANAKSAARTAFDAMQQSVALELS